MEYGQREYAQAVSGSDYVNRGQYGHPRPGAAEVLVGPKATRDAKLDTWDLHWGASNSTAV